eukprot:7380799-Prymnesium_polylepis.2
MPRCAQNAAASSRESQVTGCRSVPAPGDRPGDNQELVHVQRRQADVVRVLSLRVRLAQRRVLHVDCSGQLVALDASAAHPPLVALCDGQQHRRGGIGGCHTLVLRSGRRRWYGALWQRLPRVAQDGAKSTVLDGDLHTSHAADQVTDRLLVERFTVVEVAPRQSGYATLCVNCSELIARTERLKQRGPTVAVSLPVGDGCAIECAVAQSTACVERHLAGRRACGRLKIDGAAPMVAVETGQLG